MPTPFYAPNEDPATHERGVQASVRATLTTLNNVQLSEQRRGTDLTVRLLDACASAAGVPERSWDGDDGVHEALRSPFEYMPLIPDESTRLRDALPAIKALIVAHRRNKGGKQVDLSVDAARKQLLTEMGWLVQVASVKRTKRRGKHRGQ